MAGSGRRLPPPPPPVARKGSGELEAFGDALQAAVGKMDGRAVAPDDNIGLMDKGPPNVFGEETPTPSQLPSSVAHLQPIDTPMELATPVPVSIHARAPAAQGAGAGAWLLLLLGLGSLGGVIWFLWLR